MTLGRDFIGTSSAVALSTILCAALAAGCDADPMADAGVDASSVDAGSGDAGALFDAGVVADAGPTADAGAMDAGTDDAGTDDAGTDDAGTDDAGTDDAGTDDAGPSDAGPGDAGVPDAGCTPGVACGEANVAFVTSTTHLPSGLGGTANADAICNQRAVEAGLAGTFVAWLSSDTSNARDRLGGASGWVRTDGRPFAPTASALYAAELAYPLELDETGSRLRDSDLAVTGTSANGMATSRNCSNWSADGSATAGPYTSGSRDWTQRFAMSCDTPAHLYCLGADVQVGYQLLPVAGRRAFVSSNGFSSTGGLAEADAICASDASAAGLPGSFKALLATSAASALSRFDTTGLPWVRADGVPIADTAAELAATTELHAPVLQRANGARSNDGLAYTGAVTIDAIGSDNCENWTDPASPRGAHAGRRDRARRDSWFAINRVNCGWELSVYCFEE